MFYNDDGTIADKRFEQILASLKSKDKEALKSLFSKKALKESIQIDEEIDYLFNFFQDEVLSWTRNGGLIVDLAMDHGNRIKETKSFFDIDTDKQKYIAFILEYNEDTAHPENVGLYTLRIIRAEDEETQFGYWPDMKIPGVYRPEEAQK